MPAATNLTRDDIAGWLTLRRVLEILHTVFPPDYAKAELTERLRGGMVRSASAHASSNGKHLAAVNLIPVDQWNALSITDDFWKTATFRVKVLDQRIMSYAEVRYFDVRFHPTDIEAILIPHQGPPLQVPAQNPKPPVANKGGRPPKAWWHDFWVEMCCRIYDGDIQPPTTQAAILGLMQQWVSDNDYEAGDTVLKEAAQKLSKALKARSET
jgi:hypothetical protein